MEVAVPLRFSAAVPVWVHAFPSTLCGCDAVRIHRLRQAHGSPSAISSPELKVYKFAQLVVSFLARSVARLRPSFLEVCRSLPSNIKRPLPLNRVFARLHCQALQWFCYVGASARVCHPHFATSMHFCNVCPSTSSRPSGVYHRTCARVCSRQASSGHVPA